MKSPSKKKTLVFAIIVLLSLVFFQSAGATTSFIRWFNFTLCIWIKIDSGFNIFLFRLMGRSFGQCHLHFVLVHCHWNPAHQTKPSCPGLRE